LTPHEDGEAADMVVLNTCHIREKAAEKVYSDIGRLEPRGRHRATDRGGRLRRPGRGPGDHEARAAVDMVVGPQAYHRLPEQ
jgi:tRNA-2-methylthio-N6-dimethylallyladenosine synthase